MSQTKTQLVASPLNLNGADLTFPSSQGSANQFLRNGSTAGTLEFSALAASNLPTGSILQIVQASTSTQVSVSTTTFTDTGLSASITPSSSSNKILVIVDQMFQTSRSSSGLGAGIKLLRDSTAIHQPVEDSTGPFENYVGGITGFYGRMTITKLDSPSSTSSLTYKTQGRPYATSSTGKVHFNITSNVQNATSYITLIEVAA